MNVLYSLHFIAAVVQSMYCKPVKPHHARSDAALSPSLIISKYIFNMESKQQPNLVMKGYETYAVLKGGEKVIQFSDNSDIVTDKEASAVEVVPKGKKDPIKFIPRGRNNDMMYDIMRKIGTNVTIGSNVEFKNKVVFGDSILVYRKKRDGKTRKIIKEEVLPEEEPEIFEFLENNNFNFIRVELANDLVIFYDAYLEYILRQ
jgi:hypothetical protein